MTNIGSIQNSGTLQNVYNVDNSAEVKKASNAKGVDLKNPVDEVNLSTKGVQKEEASTAKKVGLGLASWVLPGVGQLINGETTKGAAHIAAQVALIPASALLGAAVGFPGLIAAGTANFALHAYSTYDAVINAKA